MPIDPDTLASLAADYTRHMTSIRGRRVQRLLKREFAGADSVQIVATDAGMPAVLGRSKAGAALCATDGKGSCVSVVKWLHGDAYAYETRFDLLKDALPIVDSRSFPFDGAMPSPGVVAPELARRRP